MVDMKKNRTKLVGIMVIILSTLVSVSNFQLALASSTPTIGCREGQDCVSLTNPLATTDIKTIIGNSIGAIMGIIGSITFVVFVYGGVLWLTSAGNSERIQKGLQAMLWAGIGIIVIFSSYAIITLILNTLQASPN